MLIFINGGLKAAGIYLVNKKGQILLQKRGSKTNSPNYWGCFGGKTDDGETFQQSAIREFKEESGFEGNLTDIRLLHVNKNRDGFTFVSYIAYLDEDIEVTMIGKETIDGVVEVDDARYFDFNDLLLKEYLHPGTRHTFKSKKQKIKDYINEKCNKNF